MGVKIVLIAPFGVGGASREMGELVAFGRQLQSLMGGNLEIVTLGDEVAGPARDMAAHYGLPVTAIRIPGFSHYVNETYLSVLAGEFEGKDPAVVAALHSSQGWEWAPALSARIGAGCICAVEGIVRHQGGISFQKELYGGKVKGLFVSRAATTVVTVMPGIFPPAETAEPIPGSVRYREAPAPPCKTRHAGTRRPRADTADIARAPVIVAVGNGIGSRENLVLAERLARVLPKAAVAGTRILCDRGWLGYDRQVGISGATVAPAVYFACGISGASQHVMGMRAARYVIAINTDPHAAIFHEADVCIVEDVTLFLPLLEEACGRRLGDS